MGSPRVCQRCHCRQSVRCIQPTSYLSLHAVLLPSTNLCRAATPPPGSNISHRQSCATCLPPKMACCDLLQARFNSSMVSAVCQRWQSDASNLGAVNPPLRCISPSMVLCCREALSSHAGRQHLPRTAEQAATPSSQPRVTCCSPFAAGLPAAVSQVSSSMAQSRVWPPGWWYQSTAVRPPSTSAPPGCCWLPPCAGACGCWASPGSTLSAANAIASSASCCACCMSSEGRFLAPAGSASGSAASRREASTAELGTSLTWLCPRESFPRRKPTIRILPRSHPTICQMQLLSPSSMP